MIRCPLVALVLCLASTAAADWLTAPSYYTHNPTTGGRVSQYAPIAAPTSATQPIRTSGFTHLRSTLNYGKSADNYHRVTKWGDPVQPYAAFRFPFRPYGTPYPNWGAPYIGTGTNIQLGGVYGGGRPRGGGDPYGGVGAGGNVGGVGDVGLGNGFGGGFGNGFDGNRNGFPGRGRGFRPGGFRPGGFEQPIGPLTPYPSLPFDVDRTSPLYDGYYPTYRD